MIERPLYDWMIVMPTKWNVTISITTYPYQLNEDHTRFHGLKLVPYFLLTNDLTVHHGRGAFTM